LRSQEEREKGARVPIFPSRAHPQRPKNPSIRPHLPRVPLPGDQDTWVFGGTFKIQTIELVFLEGKMLYEKLWTGIQKS
jgi:hypothetical protein